MMFRSVFAKSIYERRWTTLAWTIGLFAMAVMTMAFFPFFRDSFVSALQNIPKSLQTFLGNPDDYKSVTGYVGQQIFALRMPLMTIIMSIIVFNGLGAGDEERGTLETLLAQPVSRASVYWQKYAAGVVSSTLAVAGIWVGVLTSFVFIHESMSIWRLTIATFNCLLITLVFGSLTYFVGSVAGRKGLTVGLVSGFTFLTYLITSFAPTVDMLQTIQKFLPLYYYTSPIAATEGLSLTHVLILAGTILVPTVIGVYVFNVRDLRHE